MADSRGTRIAFVACALLAIASLVPFLFHANEGEAGDLTRPDSPAITSTTTASSDSVPRGSDTTVANEANETFDTSATEPHPPSDDARGVHGRVHWRNGSPLTAGLVRLGSAGTDPQWVSVTQDGSFQADDSQPAVGEDGSIEVWVHPGCWVDPRPFRTVIRRTDTAGRFDTDPITLPDQIDVAIVVTLDHEVRSIVRRCGYEWASIDVREAISHESLAGALAPPLASIRDPLDEHTSHFLVSIPYRPTVSAALKLRNPTIREWLQVATRRLSLNRLEVSEIRFDIDPRSTIHGTVVDHTDAAIPYASVGRNRLPGPESLLPHEERSKTGSTGEFILFESSDAPPNTITASSGSRSATHMGVRAGDTNLRLPVGLQGCLTVSVRRGASVIERFHIGSNPLLFGRESIAPLPIHRRGWAWHTQEETRGFVLTWAEGERLYETSLQRPPGDVTEMLVDVGQLDVPQCQLLAVDFADTPHRTVVRLERIEPEPLGGALFLTDIGRDPNGGATHVHGISRGRYRVTARCPASNAGPARAVEHILELGGPITTLVAAPLFD